MEMISFCIIDVLCSGLEFWLINAVRFRRPFEKDAGRERNSCSIHFNLVGDLNGWQKKIDRTNKKF